jgi:hypothetical protein
MQEGKVLRRPDAVLREVDDEGVARRRGGERRRHALLHARPNCRQHRDDALVQQQRHGAARGLGARDRGNSEQGAAPQGQLCGWERMEACGSRAAVVRVPSEDSDLALRMRSCE